MSYTLVVTGGESELNNPDLNTTFGLTCWICICIKKLLYHSLLNKILVKYID